MTWNEICACTKKLISIYRLPLAAGGMLILFAALGFFILGGSNRKIKETTDNVVTLAGEIRRGYRNRPDYWGLSTETAIKNNIIPKALLQNGKIISPIEAEISIGSGADGTMVMPGMKSFDIAYKNLSAKDCAALASYPLGAEHSLGLLSVTIKNAGGEKVFSWGGENPLPVEKNMAANICLNFNAIIWNFE